MTTRAVMDGDHFEVNAGVSLLFPLYCNDQGMLLGLDFGIAGMGYAVFGKVVHGLDVVDEISKVPTTRRGEHENTSGLGDPNLVQRGSRQLGTHVSFESRAQGVGPRQVAVDSGGEAAHLARYKRNLEGIERTGRGCRA